MNTEGENLINRGNQQERSASRRKSPETTRQAPKTKITKAYLLGLLHDATETKYTYRIAQNSLIYIKMLRSKLKGLGYNAWVYREGKNRKVYIVEFARKILTGTKISSHKDKIEYIRGYFDAEGGIAKSPKVRFYIYFAQKDLKDLTQVKKYLQELGISCGKTHNPSKRVDSDYWRFYLKTKSHKMFANIIGSYHPVKDKCLRMKI